MKSFILRIVSILFGFITFGIVAIALIGISVIWYFSKDLPSYQQLSEYKPPVISRVYASNGELIGQFAKERRLFYPIENIPQKVSQAFIAAEDKNFYNHPGVDLVGIGRAMLHNIMNVGSGKRMQGASTITQQVMKNFLFQDERPHVRKIKEAILATRFEEAFTKEQILELYLNEIFLGAGTYGVVSAAQTYFDKKLSDLDIGEIAYLAALPKGPNNYHPIRHNKQATLRRNYVLNRMYEDGYITQTEMTEAINKPLETVLGKDKKNFDATYFVEEIRRDLLQRYGESVLYNSGLMVTSTINPDLQRFAEKALRQTLIGLDRNLGWRGAIAKNVLDNTDDPIDALAGYKTPSDLYDWRTAVVTDIHKDYAIVFIKETQVHSKILTETIKWAKTPNTPVIRTANDVLSIGDVIYVQWNGINNAYDLMQIPQVNGAIMVMDPHTGRVLAQQGGFSFSTSQFNRATQAQRQPGSSFKPFVYAAALEQGFTPETLINDGPFYYVDDLGREWQPANYDEKFLGDVPMRVGLERSRNLMTIRLAKNIGMYNVIEFAKRLGVGRGMKAYLPMALGAGEVTLEEMVTAYAPFANGGYKIAPIYFDRVQDRQGKNILTADIPNCQLCIAESDKTIISKPQRIIDPMVNYQMVSMLRGVVERGTGRTLHSLGVPIAGKTGTTNDSKDVWFMGFTSDLVFGTYIGYDNPKPMGKLATGGGTAAPLIKNFLQNALSITNPQEFLPPKNTYTNKISYANPDMIPTDVATPTDVTTPTQDKNNNIGNNNNNSYTKLPNNGQTPLPKQPIQNNTPTQRQTIKQIEDTINLGTGGLY